MPSLGHILHLELLKPFLDEHKTVSVYDFGCGAGELLEVFPKNKLKQYEGVDINSSSILVANTKYGAKNTQFQVNKPTDIPQQSKQKKDIFIAVGVFQYLDPKLQKKVIKAAHQMLSADGLIAISCATDHFLYRLLNVYRFFVPHGYVNKASLLSLLTKQGFEIEYAKEKGLILAPLFSHVFVFFFDALDKVLFQTKGELGPIGKVARELARPAIALEYKLPFNVGYTLFVQARKKS